MLRKLRIALAVICFALITLLFLDFTGSAHRWFGWLAKVQFLPALLAMNLIVVAALLLVTFLFGRIYCSILCPLGVFQDAVSWLRRKPNRFTHSSALPLVRYGVLGIFAVLILLGAGSLFALFAPYSAYGRMVSSLLGPLYGLGNNLLARLAERSDSYAFYHVDVWLRSVGTLVVALVTFLVVSVLAWRNGRTYCNTICPVGTILGALARFSIFRPRIDTENCGGCGACSRACKASCIDPKSRKIDTSRCVLCLNCTEKCPKGALNYTCKERHA